MGWLEISPSSPWPERGSKTSRGRLGGPQRGPTGAAWPFLRPDQPRRRGRVGDPGSPRWVIVGGPGVVHRHARHGLRTVGPVALAAIAGMLVGASLPVTRGYFDDERVVVDAGVQELVYQTILRIPVGTVAFEELAFRGVLLDLLRGPLSLEAAVAADSVIFGLWHIVPTLATATANDIIGRRRVALVVGSVLASAFGGVVLATLRLRAATCSHRLSSTWPSTTSDTCCRGGCGPNGDVVVTSIRSQTAERAASGR